MAKVLLLENISESSRKVFEDARIDVEFLSTALAEDELIERLQGVRMLGVRSATHVTRKVLENAPDLRAVGAFSIGVNQIDLDAASEHGVAVFNAPFSNGRSVVELTICEIIALTRRLEEKNRLLHRGVWDKSAQGAFEVRGKTLGIVGYGKIGTQLSVLAEALGLNVVFYDIVARPALGNAKVLASLDELLEVSDVVSLHIDGRAENRGFFGEREFAKMKQGASFINISRGFIVNYDALERHITSGHLSGAAVDVFPSEPKKRGDSFTSPLQNLPNVILTPHIGGSTLEAQNAIGEFVANKLTDYYRRGTTTLSVNFPEIALSQMSGATRIIHIHKNHPGVLTRLNTLLSNAGFNIVSQWLRTKDELGYVVTDIDEWLPQDVFDGLKLLDDTIKVRLQH